MTCFKSATSGLAILLLSGVVAGCATVPAELPADQSKVSVDQQTYEARVAKMVQQDPLFALLTAEIASQRDGGCAADGAAAGAGGFQPCHGERRHRGHG